MPVLAIRVLLKECRLWKNPRPPMAFGKQRELHLSQFIERLSMFCKSVLQQNFLIQAFDIVSPLPLGGSMMKICSISISSWYPACHGPLPPILLFPLSTFDPTPFECWIPHQAGYFVELFAGPPRVFLFKITSQRFWYFPKRNHHFGFPICRYS